MKKVENSYTIEQFKSFLDENSVSNELCSDTDYEGKAFKYIKFQFPVAILMQSLIKHKSSFQTLIEVLWMRCGRKVKNVIPSNAKWLETS